METIFSFMSKDHDRLDSIFKEYLKLRNLDVDKAFSLFCDFEAGLRKHIVWEEEILFPVFEEKTGMQGSGPTVVMRMEHRQIEELLDKVSARLKSQDLEGIEALENALFSTLDIHNQKEVNILYPMLDNLLEDEEKEGVFSRITDAYL